MGKRSVAIPFSQVDQLTGSKDAGPCQGHPKVREELARQGLDLALPVIAWPDEEQQSWCYRNFRRGDPSLAPEGS